MNKRQTTALALYSGGLDSTLACRVVAAQGIKVVAVQFVTPFFGYDLLRRKNEHIRATREKFGIDLIVKDVTLPYLELLKKPAHGFGRYFNPCIDCKIFLLAEAKKMMPEIGASFLVTGEVIGQRPMSQRRDTLRVIERDSGCQGILLRPLCAKNLEPTQPELEGLVDREQLYGFSGRNRTPQIRLAAEFGIRDYPSPAGGCVLADPILSRRIQGYYRQHRRIVPEDVLLLMVGRQFTLPGGGWLVVGRNMQDNEKLERLRKPGDWLLQPSVIAGPTAILRYSRTIAALELAAGLVSRYAKRSSLVGGAAIIVAERDGVSREIETLALDDSIFQAWMNN
jgi:tRNA-specific 2-thiouridylase